MSNQNIKSKSINHHGGRDLAIFIVKSLENRNRSLKSINSLTFGKAVRKTVEADIFNPQQWIFEWLWDVGIIEPARQTKTINEFKPFRLVDDLEMALYELDRAIENHPKQDQ